MVEIIIMLFFAIVVGLAGASSYIYYYIFAPWNSKRKRKNKKEGK